MKTPSEHKLSRALAALLACALLPAAARCAFEDVDAGPRASAMAGAYAAQSEGLSSIFYNPAGVIGVTRYEVSLAQQKLYLGLTDGSSISRSAIAAGSPLVLKDSYWGTAAIGMDTLSLDSLYSESRIRLGWAYPLKEKIWIGLALARMSVTYGSDSYTAINPVLASGTGASAIGLDLGAIYATEGIDYGLSVQNANEPDLGIKYPNKVDRKITVGAALKRQSFTLDTDLAMAGSDIKIKAGAELPVMREKFKDRLRARAGLGLGSRDFRAVTAGFGYSAGAYRVDYSFNYPLSGLAGTMGSHQLGVVVAWGQARGPLADRRDPYAEEEKAPEPPPGTGGPGLGGEGMELKKGPSNADRSKAAKLLREAQDDIRKGNYAAAAKGFKKADDLLIDNQQVKETLTTLESVSAAVPEAAQRTERDELLRKSVGRLMAKNTDAVLYATYARQKWARDAAVARLYNIIAREFPETASELRLLPGITITDQLLQDALDFIRNGRFIQAISTLQRVLQLEPDNIAALTRMGSAYWAIDKKDLARENWQRVLQLDPNNTEVIQFMKMN